MSETKRVTLRWREGLRFSGGEPGGPEVSVDGDNASAPGPMLQLLLAAAACSRSDVVLILAKMRTRLEAFRIDVAGVRRDHEPRRYVAIHLDYHLRGEGVDEAKARRAVELSIEKYCSVIHSLAPDIRITHAVRMA